MRIQPLHSQLVVKPIISGDVKGSILIPATAKDNAPYRFADVLEVGLGRVNQAGLTVPLQVKIGDVVAFAKGAGLPFPLEVDGRDEEVLLIDEQYILGVVHDFARPTLLYALDGKLATMVPQSRTQSGFNQGALPDSSYENQVLLDRAERDFGIDCSDHVDEVE